MKPSNAVLLLSLLMGLFPGFIVWLGGNDIFIRGDYLAISVLLGTLLGTVVYMMGLLVVGTK